MTASVAAAAVPAAVAAAAALPLQLSPPPLQPPLPPRPLFAVAAVACRLPLPSSPCGHDAVRIVPLSRWDADDGWFDRGGKSSSPSTPPPPLPKRFGAFLEKTALFDARCFSLSSAEAAALDPQQRLLLDCGAEALAKAPEMMEGEREGERGGTFFRVASSTPQQNIFFFDSAQSLIILTRFSPRFFSKYFPRPTTDPSSVSVAIGISYTEYYLNASDAGLLSALSATSGTLSAAAGRLSYSLGLRGASVAVDTACSASLVGLQLTVSSFLREAEGVGRRGKTEKGGGGGGGEKASSPPLSSSSSLASRLLPLVLEAARRTLGTAEPPAPDAPLMSLGLESAGALELRAALARVAAAAASGVAASPSSSSSSSASSSSDSALELPATFVFDHPTPAAMVSALAEILISAQPPPPQEGKGEIEIAAPSARPAAKRTTPAKKKKPPPPPPRPSAPLWRRPRPSQAAVAVLSVAARLPSGKMTSSCSPSDPLTAAAPLFAGADDLPLPTPPARWDADEYYAPQEAARTNALSSSPSSSHRHAGLTLYARCAALVDSLELFDAQAFGLSPAEAAATDPQCRHLLEAAGSALLSVSSSSSASSTSAFFTSPLVRSRTAVFTGSMFQEHAQLQYDAGERGVSASPAVATGNGISYLCGRVSFAFGLQGACVATDTACSASLVAAHLAFRALTTGSGGSGSAGSGSRGGGKTSSSSSSGFDADAAVVGGVNALLLPITTCTISGLQALSPEGRCKTFDASADGYGRGEGFLAAVLCREGDVSASVSLSSVAPPSSSAPSSSVISPLALLVASAVGQDGRSSSLTAPSGPAQAALIRGVVASASASAAAAAASSSSVLPPPPPPPPLLLLPALVAMHGTGTPLGDPIELGALSSALLGGERGGKRGTATSSKTALAAPKACFGHTEGAAGLGGLAAAASLRSRCAPPAPSVRSLNPYVSAALEDWERKGRVHVGGGGGVGVGGGGAIARSRARRCCRLRRRRWRRRRELPPRLLPLSSPRRPPPSGCPARTRKRFFPPQRTQQLLSLLSFPGTERGGGRRCGRWRGPRPGSPPSPSPLRPRPGRHRRRRRRSRCASPGFPRSPG